MQLPMKYKSLYNIKPDRSDQTRPNVHLMWMPGGWQECSDISSKISPKLQQFSAHGQLEVTSLCLVAIAVLSLL